MLYRRAGFPACGLLAWLTAAAATAADPLFTREQRERLVAFWNAPGRYRVEPADPPGRLWRVRQTPEGSRWLLAVQRAALGPGKQPPNRPSGLGETRPEWETWIAARWERDRWEAARLAAALNGAAAPAVPEPPHAGPMPDDLAGAAGAPPALTAAVAPRAYRVTLADGSTVRYTDQVDVRPRFAHFRNPQGVSEAGTPLGFVPAEDAAAVFRQAGLSAGAVRAFLAVSRLEGGFDSVNTFDTGGISVGFIQFAALEHGRGSLAAVLTRMREETPADFERDFRAFGIDVDDAGAIAVVDPSTGAELRGAEAVQRCIDDKRLVAVFQVAGRRPAFQRAQVRTAAAMFWPADDEVRVTVGRRALTARVSDIVRSEAGLATLLDRKVNRGNLDPFADLVRRVAERERVTELRAVARWEREIVAALRFRADFLQDQTLSQPRAER